MRNAMRGAVLALLGWAAGVDAQEVGVDVHQDFRGGKATQRPLLLSGPDANALVKSEEQGLRITLPAGRKDPKSVGLVLMTPVSGDFEIAAEYELLALKEWQPGQAAGFEIWLRTDTASDEAISLTRLRRYPAPGTPPHDAYLWFRLTTDKGQRRSVRRDAPAGGTAGKMRITRRGTTLVLAVCEEGQDSFRELGRSELGGEKVKMIRFTASTDNQPVAADLLLRSVRVRTLTPEPLAAKPLPATGQASIDVTRNATSVHDAPTPAQPISGGTDPAKSVPGPSTGYLDFITMALTLGLMAAAGIGLLVRCRRHPATEAAVPSPPDVPDETSVRRMTCAACGRRLAVRAALAGKLVRCTCGERVSVPVDARVRAGEGKQE